MKKHCRYCSDFLFARPSFLLGLARTLDISGQFAVYNESKTGQEADFRARVCDWMVVQQDLNASWGDVVDAEPDFVRTWLDAVRKDPTLLKGHPALVGRENTHELEMAPST
jgi:hypothetical protein